jgi:hypothetical protein
MTIPCSSCCSGTTKEWNGEPPLDLFDAFGTRDKTLHTNVGGQAGVPWFEVGARGPVLRPALDVSSDPKPIA